MFLLCTNTLPCVFAPFGKSSCQKDPIEEQTSCSGWGEDVASPISHRSLHNVSCFMMRSDAHSDPLNIWEAKCALSTSTAQASCSNPAAVDHGARTSINQGASGTNTGVHEWKLSLTDEKNLESWSQSQIFNPDTGKH